MSARRPVGVLGAAQPKRGGKTPFAGVIGVVGFEPALSSSRKAVLAQSSGIIDKTKTFVKCSKKDTGSFLGGAVPSPSSS